MYFIGLRSESPNDNYIGLAEINEGAASVEWWTQLYVPWRHEGCWNGFSFLLHCIPTGAQFILVQQFSHAQQMHFNIILRYDCLTLRAILVSFSKKEGLYSTTVLPYKVYWRNLMFLNKLLRHIVALVSVSYANGRKSYMAIMDWPPISTILANINLRNVLNSTFVNWYVCMVWGISFGEGGLCRCWLQVVISEKSSHKTDRSNKTLVNFKSATYEFEEMTVLTAALSTTKNIITNVLSEWRATGWMISWRVWLRWLNSAAWMYTDLCQNKLRNRPIVHGTMQDAILQIGCRFTLENLFPFFLIEDSTMKDRPMSFLVFIFHPAPVV